MDRNLYAVFDANNFYVSCERVFSPRLQNKPAVVASQSGGIVLARSNEAKALGVPMAAPVFKWRDFFDEHQVLVAPANFPLYADISARIEQILHETFPFVEDYSIDESFVVFPHALERSSEIAQQCGLVRQKILKWTGVPVSVGIAQTKTLSKVAVKYAKKLSTGVFSVITEAERLSALNTFPLEDIWGVGWALQKKLPAYGISTAMQLAQSDPVAIRKHFSVVLAKTVQELQGTPCFEVSDVVPDTKSMMSTGSFGQEITERQEVQTRLLEFAALVAERLRSHSLLAGGMVIFTRGNKHHKERGYAALQKVVTFSPSTSSTTEFAKIIEQSMPEVFFEGMQVKRAGVYAFNILPESTEQFSLFSPPDSIKRNKEQKAFAVIDKINKKWGERIIAPALLLAKKGKTPRLFTSTNRVSLRYWKQILKIRI